MHGELFTESSPHHEVMHPHAAAMTDFDWAELERSLGELKETTEPCDYAAAALVIRRIIHWLVPPNIRQREKYGHMTLARRAIMLAYFIDRRYLESPTLKEIAGELQCTDQNLSLLVQSLRDLFGIPKAPRQSQRPSGDESTRPAS